MLSKRSRIFAVFGAVGLFLVLAQEVLAVVGRPLTPVSVVAGAAATCR